MSIHQILDESKRITFLTGAGVSVDSGIPDFKSTDETWSYSVSRTNVISRSFFSRNPKVFWRIYRELFESKLNAKPNDFHKWIASLEENHEVTVVTQNVDGLHSKAGSSNVLEVHGSVSRVTCSRQSCSETYPASEFSLVEVPRCLKCRKILKPDVCLFGEQVQSFDKAAEAIETADLFIVAGTSLDVSPINLLPKFAETSNKKVHRLWLNKTSEPEGYDFTNKFIASFDEFLKFINNDPLYNQEAS